VRDIRLSEYTGAGQRAPGPVKTASALRQRLVISDVPQPARIVSAAGRRRAPRKHEVPMELIQSECGDKIEAQFVLDGDKEE